ncbi:sugar transferase [Roseobacter sp. CCS2]|uniref:sugar transferase n=1 Tax=Roseobacter sp. CCS2 TaxID=391593 RepID=UPI0000F3C633|nr:sugar transferase [Roseobacter sp. CCS2]EBA11543.1 exopolysaccharide production protein exoy [Roseobacter sp. CCS2]
MPILETVGFTAFDEKRTRGPVGDIALSQPASGYAVVGGASKRLFDICAALIALIMLAPLFLFTAIAIKLVSPGPVLYGHRRIGHNGRYFKCWKFRSMVTDGDAVLAKYLADHPQERDEWVRSRKLRDDPRVTRLGAVLRAYSVDELPQIINVLMGDMSIVGPRPVVRDELDIYGSAAAQYLRSRPGITGLWQVSGRSDTSYEQRIKFDTQYVQNWSLAADLWIIMRTIPAVVSSKGSY